ncbi:MAG TPA: glycosyl hydrolase [Streptosporangiaceae bacterium]
MRRTAVMAAAMPLVAAALIGGVLVATNHARLPSLPALTSPTPSPSGNAGSGTLPCERANAPTPFAGVAVNPAIGANVRSFERLTGAPIHVVEFYNSFSRPFQRSEAAQASALGALPLIQLNPRNLSLAQIAAGQYDSSIRAYADSVRAFRCRVILSFGHEMNGWWYTWGLPHTTPATFKAAWHHIHDIFAARHVTNVIWSWDPTHQYQQYQSGKTATLASKWYPGDAYVDWVGIDGYMGPGQDFRQVFGVALRSIRSVTSKPIYLAETGVASGPNEARQIAELFAGARQWHMVGLIWFNMNRKNTWSLVGRPAADAAYRKAMASFEALRPGQVRGG